MNQSFGELEKLISTRAALIDKELDLLSFVIEPAELAEVVKYALSQRGKRLRSTILTLSCESVGGTLAQSLVPALVVEMIHNTSLILDDIIDSSETRRGKATINARWGNHMALIAADAMLALTIKQAARSDLQVTRAIIECASTSLLRLAEGEAMELTNRDYGIDDYYKIAQKKTASLFRASSEVGALVGGGTKKEVDALNRYGDNIGIAFQMKDDILDFTSDKETLGKPIMIDLKMNRPTLVLLLAMKNGLKREDMLKMSREELLKALKPSIEEAEKLAQDKANAARDALKPIRDSKYKTHLEDLCDYILTRDK
ncbi:farnesyltranstransferase [Methanocella sp. CWC-04]|uniref:Farnesyltranstransferase n=1 Tax=Methanooceanicella nereidis TaxID=2052831 RepID=A0AAP2REY6_9EURY|nr:polyprenyl synthetase family protein [Methanocella sp. CWC-04]MCD1296124.1 farnesyltranstransferase [Methanocella sp. CWC-04]